MPLITLFERARCYCLAFANEINRRMQERRFGDEMHWLFPSTRVLWNAEFITFRSLAFARENTVNDSSRSLEWANAKQTFKNEAVLFGMFCYHK